MGYTNSGLVVYRKLSPNHSGQRTHSIDRITPHCVVSQCSAEGLGDWFAKSSTQASSNYGIDKDGRVGLYVEEKNRSWCSSSNANDQRAITIECASDTSEPYAFRDVVYKKLIALCVDICKRNGKKKLIWFGDKDKTLNYSPKSDEMVLTVHRWFANKSCPGNWMYSRMGDLASKVTAQLGGSSSGGSGYSGSGSTSSGTNTKFPETPFLVTVIIDDLNIRTEGSMSGKVVGQTGKGVFTITKVKNGWGKLKSGVGWIYLENPSYCTVGKAVASQPSTPTAQPVTPTTGETADQIRARVVNRAISYLGCNEADGSHRKIIDLYNSQNPLPVGYKVTYSDAWCDAFASAVAVAENLTDIIPTECGCERHIQLFKKLGRWVEDDAYVPYPGDYIFYDWQDSGSDDNNGGADHVGIVVSVSGSTIKVIEGNKSNAVGYRNISVNGRYIRGYGVPDYEGKASAVAVPTIPATPVPADPADPEKTIWDALFAEIKNPYGVAGLVGNLYAESALKASNLQNNGNSRLGMSDEEFTAAMDAGVYGDDTFIHDGYGYGLAQWTYYSRKAALLAFAKNQDVSIGDLSMQLAFLLQEIKGYTSVWNTLLNAKTVRDASDAVLTKYERPADQSEAVQVKRAGFGQKYFDKYAGLVPAESTQPTTKYYRVRKSWADKASQIGAFTVLQNAVNAVDANPGYAAFDDNGNQVYPEAQTSFQPYPVRVSVSDLNYRKGPSTSYQSWGYIEPGIYTIVDEKDGWGLLKAYADKRNGWIKLSYTERI